MEFTKFKKNFSVGDNVVVHYEGEFYPGIIEAKKKEELKVSTNYCLELICVCILLNQFFFFLVKNS